MSSTYTGNPNNGWKTSIKVHDDNNKPTAASFAAITMPIMDDLAFLYARGIQGVGFVTSTVNPSGGAIVGPPMGVANTWQDFPSSNGLTPYVDVPNCSATDVLLCLAAGSFAKEGQIKADVRLNTIQDFGGAGTSAAVDGSEAKVLADVSPADSERITMIGRKVLTVAGTCRVILQGRNVDNAGRVGVDRGLVDGAGTTFTLIVLRIRSYS